MLKLPIAKATDDTNAELVSMSNRAMQGVRTLTDIDADDLQIGITPKQTVFTNDHVTLYRYAPDVSKHVTTPVLIVYALVNRPYMMDLQENRSLIRQLIAQGLDVYLIDWGYPTRNDRWLTLDDYVNDYVDSCVDHICEAHDLDAITLMGVCQGGVLSLCYAAQYPERISNLITMATSVDFHVDEGVLNAWLRYTQTHETVDLNSMVDALGNIPGDLMNFGFLMLKPFELGSQKYLTLLDSIDDDEYSANFLRMEKWIFDSPDQAGETWRQYINDFYVHNKLIKGTLELDGEIIDLRQITMPVLNVYAEHDHLVPPASSRALRDHVTSDDYTEASFPVGHVGMYVSRKVQDELPQLLTQWLCERA